MANQPRIGEKEERSERTTEYRRVDRTFVVSFVIPFCNVGFHGFVVRFGVCCKQSRGLPMIDELYDCLTDDGPHREVSSVLQQ